MPHIHPMRHVLKIAMTVAVAGAALVAVIAAAIPIWLLLRVPSALVPPGASTPAVPLDRSRRND